MTEAQLIDVMTSRYIDADLAYRTMPAVERRHMIAALRDVEAQHWLAVHHDMRMAVAILRRLGALKDAAALEALAPPDAD